MENCYSCLQSYAIISGELLDRQNVTDGLWHLLYTVEASQSHVEFWVLEGTQNCSFRFFQIHKNVSFFYSK